MILPSSSAFFRRWKGTTKTTTTISNNNNAINNNQTTRNIVLFPLSLSSLSSNTAHTVSHQYRHHRYCLQWSCCSFSSSSGRITKTEENKKNNNNNNIIHQFKNNISKHWRRDGSIFFSIYGFMYSSIKSLLSSSNNNTNTIMYGYLYMNH